MKEIIRILNKAKRILILSHLRPDGDSISSQKALYLVLKNMGKEVKITARDNVPELYQFLDKDNVFSTDFSEDYHPDTVVYLDSAHRDRVGRDLIGKLSRQINNAVTVNIDHHVSNENYADYNYVDPDMSSTCEILYTMFNKMNAAIDPDTATAILTGIVTDTGYFKYKSVTSSTLKTAASLMDSGADLYSVSEKIYMNRPLAKVQLESRVLERIEMMEDRAVSFIYNKDFTELGAKSEYTDGIVNQMLYIRGITLSVLIIEHGKDVRISFRSKGDKYNVNNIAALIDGGGHPNASGAYMDNTDAVKAGTIVKEIIGKLE
ncbi:MAG: bifunctional oligoribonuclease/PAP phosphatase NrnA [bacterium]